MMTVVPGDGLPFGDFTGNYYPPTSYHSGTIDFLSPPAVGDPLTIATNYLKQNLGSYSLTTADLNNYSVGNNYKDKDGEGHVYLQQKYNGLPVADAYAMVNLTSNGRVVSASANFADVSYPTAALPLTPTVNRGQALTAFATHAGLTPTAPLQLVSPPSGLNQKTLVKVPGLSNENITMQLQYVPTPTGVDLAWEIICKIPDESHWYDVSVIAAGPDAGKVSRAGDYVADASYNVFPIPVENPTDGTRFIVIDPQDPIASPFGWHDVNGVPGPEFLDTQGNNVQAQDDLDGNNTGGTRPFGGPTLDFNSPLSFPNFPIANLNAGITQAFYLANVAHDVTYHYGFDELAGNFQFKNYTAPLNQAFDFDAVDLDVQDPAAFTNAFFGTPPDGFAPNMTVGLSFFGNTGNGLIPLGTPLDIALDTTVVLHEYFHGVSNRLTGGPSNALALQAIQSGGMGEGWSDWFSFVLTMKATDNKFSQWKQGEYFLPTAGARAFPYSFDLTVDPRRLSDYNAPADPTLPFPISNGGSEVHNAGEIWSAALIDMTWLLTDKYGFDPNVYTGTGGNNTALQLVIDALKLQPPNPSFIQARDAIVAADLALTGGDNYDLIWQAFARRGIGLSANSGTGATSIVVAEAFDFPPPLARVEGTIFNDSNGNAKRDVGELPLADWTVYVDLNNNGILDAASERQFTTGADGLYHFQFVTNQSVTVRQILQPNFKQTLPKNNAPVQVFVTRGNTVTADFGNQGLPGEINGLKWNDLNGNGVRDTDALGVLEPGLQGVVIYADLNNDLKLNVLEPSTVTDHNGRYSLKLPAGTYSIREVLQAGLTQTFPDPTGISGFGYTNVALASSQVVSLDFGNIASLDFGDAPEIYGTSLPVGPRHGILPGFFLGASIDPESNGQPTADATGDDVNGADDEDGVSFGNALGASPSVSPGLLKTITVTVSTGANSAGKLQGWIDYNGDGDFSDPGEKVFSNLALGAGAHSLSFTPPTLASGAIALGPTFARFRYGYESNLGPTGAAQAGEVEDYALLIQPNSPTAVPDDFIVKQGTPDPIFLDVVANDPTTSFGPPSIVPGSFPAVLASGSTLTLSGNKIIYKPASSFLGTETFTYRVTDGNSESPNGKVTINVIVRDPRAIDDTYTVAAQPGAALPITLGPGDPLILANTQKVTDNDLTAHPAATRIIARTNPDFAISADEKTLIFTPPSPGFTGTAITDYTIIDDDNDFPVTSSARVTVQVVNGVTQAAASHRARLDVEILKLDPATHTYVPATTVEAGSLFLVRVTSQDLRPDNDVPGHLATNLNRGVEAAYLDLDLILTNPGNLATPDARPASFFASPVLSVGNPQGMSIVFDGSPSGVTGVVQAGATAISFGGGPGLDDSDDFYRNQNVVFTSGALQGQIGRVIGYNGATHTFNFGTNTFTAAPQAGDTFRLDIPRYGSSDFGTPNAPVQGDIDEAGATHFEASGNPVGLNTKVVFSVLMRANAATPAGQPLQILSDPADQDPERQIILAGDTSDPVNPVLPEKITNIDDGKVFYKPSGPLTITGGSAEFTNLTNPFDVNDDSNVTPLDALLIINDINVNGGGTVSSSLVTAASSSSSTRVFLDVNKDSQIAPLDALLIINYLNGLKITAHSGAGGEGEGESTSVAAADNAAIDASLSADAADAIYADLYSTGTKKKSQ